MDHYMQSFYPYGFVGENTLDTPDLQYLQRRSHEYAQLTQRFMQPPLPPPESVPPPPPPEPHPRQSSQYRQTYERLSPLIPSAPTENGLQPQPPHPMHQGSNTNRYNNRRHNNNHNRYNSNQTHHHNISRHNNNPQSNYHNHYQNSYHNNPSSNHQQINSRQEQQPKRPAPEDDDCSNRSKRSRKKKKSLANSNTVLRHWNEEAAKLVLQTEKELNGLDHQKQLIIKFPDEDLNRDIVLGYHSAITKVHFQHPSTPRYCFITLDEESDPDEVIKVLNKTPFGHGFLIAERKNPREEKVTDARDVDVCSLFVGNLPNHIKHAEVYQLYPESRRIDIGYAAVQRYKRYAFVHFYTPEEALAAYRRTFNRNSSSNSSMVVRFRRVNGSASVPNERKVQNPPRSSRQGAENSGKDLDYCEDEEEDLEEEEDEEHVGEESVQRHVDDKSSQVTKEKSASNEDDPVRSLEQLLQNQPEDVNSEPAPEKPSEKTFILPSTVKIKEEPQDELTDEPEEAQPPWMGQLPVIPEEEPKQEIITSDINDIDIPVKKEIDDQLSDYFRACAAYETSNTNIDDLLGDGNAAPTKNLSYRLSDKGKTLYADISNTLSKSIDHVIKQGPASGLVDKQLQH